MRGRRGTRPATDAAASIVRFAPDDLLSQSAFSRDGKLLAVPIVMYRTRIRRTTDGGSWKSSPPLDHQVSCIAVDNSDEQLAIGEQNGDVLLWSIPTLRWKWLQKGQGKPVTHLDFSLDGQRIATTDDTKRVAVFDTDTGETVCEVFSPETIHDLALNPEGEMLATAGAIITLWDVETGKRSTTFHGHRSCVHRLRFSQDGKWLASASCADSLVIWDLVTSTQRRVLKTDMGAVVDMAFLPDTQSIRVLSQDGTVHIWEFATNTVSASLVSPEVKDNAQRDPVTGPVPASNQSSVLFTPDGESVVVGGIDQVTWYNADTGERSGAMDGSFMRIWRRVLISGPCGS